VSVLTGDWVSLRGLEFKATLGVLEWEQQTSQRVVIDVDLRLSLTRAGDDDELAASVDYAQVADQLKFLVQEGRFRLLESIALAGCRLLLADPEPCEERARIDEVRIRLQKPEVMGGNPVPAVSMSREGPTDLSERIVLEGVREALLVHTPRTTAWRRVLDAGTSWTPEPHQACFVLGGAFEEGTSFLAGSSGLVLLVVAPEAAGSDQSITPS
jgi:dihydroneopterin aldolase